MELMPAFIRLDSNIFSGESKPERRSGKRIIASTAFRLEFQVR